jgi:hypothetical protein
MQYPLEIHIDGVRLDTFDDESLRIKKSAKDLKNVSKVFTAFSQSFTIPASKTNNKIFKHYYNNDIVNGFDARTYKAAELKLNGVSYDNGNIALESVKMSMGEPYSYTIRFYGKLTELAKQIGEDYLHDLDTSADNISNPDFEALLAEDQSSSIGSPIPAVSFPLSSNNSRLLYHSGDEDYPHHFEIDKTINCAFRSTSTHPSYGITSNMLTGAYKVGSIIDALESKYNLLFSGLRVPYIESYRLLLNSANRENLGESFNFDVSGLPTVALQVSSNGVNEDVIVSDSTGINTTSFFVNERGVTTDIASTSGKNYYQIRYSATTSLPNFKLHLLKDNEIISTTTVSEGQDTSSLTNHVSGTTDTIYSASPQESPSRFTFRVEAAGNGTVTVNFRFARFEGSTSFAQDITAYQTTTVTTSSTGDDFYNVSAQLPKLKIKDFLNILFKTFNLIPEIVKTDVHENTVICRHYDNYIYSGNTVDISKYVNIDSQTVKPTNIYSGIDFKNAEVKTSMESNFLKVNGREYGTLDFQLEVDETKLTGKPFELKLDTHRIPLERLTDLDDGSLSNAMYLQLTDINNDRVDIGATFLYTANSTGANIAYYDGTSVVNIPDVVVPSNMFYAGYQIDPYNGQCGNFWGYEGDEFYQDYRFQGLGSVNMFWQGYLDVIFDSKSRAFKCEAYLPINKLIDLSPADKIIINNKKYLIESFSTDFGSGKTSFSLISVSSEVMENFEASQQTVTPAAGNSVTINYMSSALGYIVTTNSTTVNAIGGIKNIVEY